MLTDAGLQEQNWTIFILLVPQKENLFRHLKPVLTGQIMIKIERPERIGINI